MENSKLLAILRKLNKSELLRLKDFVKSPYFNQNQEVIQLYNYLRKIAPHFPPKKIVKPQVYHNLFPDLAYDAKHMNYLMNFLVKTIEKFIAIERFTAHPFQSANELARGFSEKNLNKHFQFQFKKLEEQLKKHPTRDHHYYEQRLALAKISEQNFTKVLSTRKSNKHLKEVSNAIDTNYLVNKLMYTIAMLDFSKQFNYEYKIGLPDLIENYLPNTDFLKNDTINFYYQWYLLIKNETDIKHYEVFSNLFHTNKSLFSSIVIKDVYYSLINYCIRKIGRNQDAFKKELLDLYINGIETKVLLEKGFLSPWTYKNIIRLSFGLKSYEWIDRFIEQMVEQLPRKARSDAYHYNMAYLHFEKHEYNVAVHHLTKVEFSDVSYLMDSKILRMKIYFEEHEFEPLLALIKSFQSLVQRNQFISKEAKIAYQNFCKALYQLSRVSKITALDFRSMIENMRLLTERKWLISKAERIKKTH